MSTSGAGEATILEIMDQPDGWMEALLRVDDIAKDLRRALYDLDEVLFVGCGAAYHAALVAAPLYRHVTGGRARAAQGGELRFFEQATIPDPAATLVVAMSRSGQTTEMVEGVQRAKEEGATVVAMTCYRGSELAQLADLPVILERAQEMSVMTTASFTAMAVACQALAAHAANDGELLAALAALIPRGKAVVENYAALGELLGQEESVERFVFVGAAPLYGYALEADAKIKEGSQLPSEAVQLLEHRHKPWVSVDPTVHVTLLAADASQAPEHAFLREMREKEARLLLVCDNTEHPGVEFADETVDVQTGSSEFVRGPLYMPILQLMAAHRAILVGYDPDAPDRLVQEAAPEPADEPS